MKTSASVVLSLKFTAIVNLMLLQSGGSERPTSGLKVPPSSDWEAEIDSYRCALKKNYLIHRPLCPLFLPIEYERKFFANPSCSHPLG
jgi:hypothetical protein